jgi:DNA-binding CsgD family transcriptional regulator
MDKREPSPDISDSIISVCKKIERNSESKKAENTEDISHSEEPFLCFFTNYVRSVLKVDRVFIALLNYNEKYVETLCESLAPGVQSFAGRYSLPDYEFALLDTAQRQSTQFAVNDAENHIEEYKLGQKEGLGKYYPLGARSVVWTALTIENQEGNSVYVGNLGVNHSQPVDWSEQDLEFLYNIGQQVTSYLSDGGFVTSEGIEYPKQVTCSQIEKADIVQFKELSIFKENQASIIRLVVQGKGNQEIADKLGYSVNNIEYHLKEIFRKVGIRRRVELAKWYMENSKSK